MAGGICSFLTAHLTLQETEMRATCPRKDRLSARNLGINRDELGFHPMNLYQRKAYLARAILGYWDTGTGNLC